MLLAVTLEDLCIHTPREVVHVENPVFALSYEPSALGQEYKVLLNSRLLQEEGFYL
jgi:stage II sporulation protein GA (sporulation sigma-E factor processing peptidase)